MQQLCLMKYIENEIFNSTSKFLSKKVMTSYFSYQLLQIANLIGLF